jgi:Leucine-rich repeat (LRR) protein
VSALRTMTGLRKLILYRAPKVTDFSPVGRLVNLVELNLAFSSLEDMAWVAGLQSLERVDVGLAKVADMTPLAQCQKLETIDAYRNEGSVAGLSALKALPNLKRLRIRKRGVTRADLAGLQQALPKLVIEQL